MPAKETKGKGTGKPDPKRQARKSRKQRHIVRVSPGAVGWKVVYDGFTTRVWTQKEAMALGVLVGNLAGLEAPTSLYRYNRLGKIVEERTYPASADPAKTPG